MNEETTQKEIILPEEFVNLIRKKAELNGEGGRPSFLQLQKQKGKDPLDAILDILELNYLKDRPYRKLAKKFETSYHTIFRLLKLAEPWKKEIAHYLVTIPRRKNFFNKNSETSDYETVQLYIERAKRDKLRNWKPVINSAKKCWKFLKYKDPSRWTANDVVKYLDQLIGYGAQSNHLDAIRQVAPQIKDQVKTGRFREKIQRRKKEIFGPEYQMIRTALKMAEMDYELLVMDLHVTTGAREGTKDTKAGICGISWTKFKKNFTRLDLWESKVRGGFWSRDCPVDLFFLDLPERLRDLWIERGKPQDAKVIEGGYKGLLDVYGTIRNVVAEEYRHKIEPSLFKELTDLKPHDADKIHVNLCWEAEIPIEVVAGDYEGGMEASGLCGRVWLSTDTIKKYYLSLNKRSKRMAKIYAKVKEYAHQFNGERSTEALVIAEDVKA